MASIAVIDDLAAIIIIALFYTETIAMTPLVVIAFALIGLFILNRRNVCSTAPYLLLGLILWAAVLKSGVHATLAGVVVALFIPIHSKRDENRHPCEDIQHALHPWVAFLILPLFAFANAGVSFSGITWASFSEPLTLGIILGLLVGKPVGIFTAMWLCIKSGLSPMPDNVNWRQLFGISLLCGIGFTMSLFIGGLAFTDVEMQIPIRLGVITASVIAAVLGYLVLRYSPSAEPITVDKDVEKEVDILENKKRHDT